MAPVDFTGVFPIVITPFDADENPNLESFDRIVRFMRKLGVDGITILGVLGESNRLLDAEREALIRTAIAALALLMLLFVHYRDLVFLGVDPEGAVAARRPVIQIRFLAIVITALVVISAITAVGIVLVIGLLCAPVLVHVERSRSLSDLMLRSAGTGLLLCGGGMMLSIAIDLPPGPLIGTMCLGLIMTHKTREQNK